jgi:hypothetical protein
MDDLSLWHKCRNPFIPRRTVEGGWTNIIAQVWRRRRPDGKWEYRQDEESVESWQTRQW